MECREKINFGEVWKELLTCRLYQELKKHSEGNKKVAEYILKKTAVI